MQKNVSFTISGGYQGFVSGTVRLVDANNDLFDRTIVSNLLDAAQKVSGIKIDFDPFPTGLGSIPTIVGMKDLLGALFAIRMLRRGQVKPTGRFKNCVVVPGGKQEIDINIPIPSGILCYTFANYDWCMITKYWMLVDGGEWDRNCNYRYPVVLGVDETISC